MLEQFVCFGRHICYGMLSLGVSLLYWITDIWMIFWFGLCLMLRYVLNVSTTLWFS